MISKSVNINIIYLQHCLVYPSATTHLDMSFPLCYVLWSERVYSVRGAPGISSAGAANCLVTRTSSAQLQPSLPLTGTPLPCT